MTPLDGPTVTDRARSLSRRGKLPGFAAPVPRGIFAFSAFGAPLDYVVTATLLPRGHSNELTFTGKVQPRLPLIFAIAITLSIWPGEPITDSLIRSYFDSYSFPGWVTWAWYLPLTVLPLPFMLVRMWKLSARAAYAHALESVAIIEAALTVSDAAPSQDTGRATPGNNAATRVASSGEQRPHTQTR